jgi:hypothetical protein
MPTSAEMIDLEADLMFVGLSREPSPKVFAVTTTPLRSAMMLSIGPSRAAPSRADWSSPADDVRAGAARAAAKLSGENRARAVD